jgi:hypothetical protein
MHRSASQTDISAYIGGVDDVRAVELLLFGGRACDSVVNEHKPVVCLLISREVLQVTGANFL